MLPIISTILHQTKQFIMGLQEDYWNASYKKPYKTDFDTVTACKEEKIQNLVKEI